MSFRILTGILLGPLDFEAEKDLIILMISSELTGWRKIEFGLLFLRKLEKWWLEGGIGDLTWSTTDVKKSLKVLATVSESEDMVLSIDKEMGFCVFLDFSEIKSLIDPSPNFVHISGILIEIRCEVICFTSPTKCNYVTMIVRFGFRTLRLNEFPKIGVTYIHRFYDTRSDPRLELCFELSFGKPDSG